MMRIVALLAGFVMAGVMLSFGLVLAVRILLPSWYAMPAALLHMTSQKVPAAQAPASPQTVVQFDQAAPTPAPIAQSDEPTPVTLQPTLAAVAQTGVATAIPERPTAVPVAAESSAAQVLGSDGSGPLLPDRRFNVLLLGSDNDLKFAPTAVLTQSMILVSIDPSAPDVAMISIPRDFWVPIGGYGYQKIDVAYEVGGIALARSTVEKLFGVKIDYYAWIGLNGLVQVIDTLGGVDVNVQHPILDEVYPDDLNSNDPYAFFRLYIPAGPQHLDGTTALEYVRSRHGDLQSDFGRSARQQQVLLAIKNRVQTLSGLSQAPQLVTDLQDSVKTDLSLPAVLQLAALARKVPPTAIRLQVLSAPDFASLGYSPDGTEQVVFPNWSAIRPAVARLLQPSRSAVNAAASGN
ncbi:MAG: LCP family protein [Chloroflexi bacterium]|nr:LCP family protein [Chloroflexota bacterium]